MQPNDFRERLVRDTQALDAAGLLKRERLIGSAQGPVVTLVDAALRLKDELPEGTPATPYLRVYQESAMRAILDCQPYKLPAAFFDEWKYFAPVFTERKT